MRLEDIVNFRMGDGYNKFITNKSTCSEIKMPQKIPDIFHRFKYVIHPEYSICNTGSNLLDAVLINPHQISNFISTRLYLQFPEIKILVVTGSDNKSSELSNQEKST